ncbi:MAG TPA: ATP-binding protein [Nitrospiria bacterium]|nr:ATP-binding protein [Nitrospiria bacterium]
MTLNRREIPSDDLRARFDPDQFSFTTTEELVPQDAVIGQERAVRAMDFGLHIQDRGYNIYVSGVPGTGTNSIVKSMIKRVAETQSTPDDWCYVHNFQDPDRPKAMSLPAGKGREFQREMERLIGALQLELPRVFQSKEYEDQRRQLEETFSKARDGLTNQLEEQARKYEFIIKSTAFGIAVVPMIKGKPIETEQLDELDSLTRAEIERKQKSLHEHIHAFVQQIRALRDEMHRKIAELDRQAAHYTSEHAFESLRKNYRGFPKVMDYIETVQQDVLENFKDFLPEQETAMRIPGLEIESPRKSMTRYAVNVVVDNAGTQGAPLVEEGNPTYNNLIGRIEKKGRLGTLYTDFTLIKAGSLLQANGGYLVLNVLDVLRSPFTWDALKRVIKNKEIKIEDIGELYGVIASAGIKPEPIPVHLRVVLMGNPLIYYLLHAYDEDFEKMYKVKVDFAQEQGRDAGAPIQYARFVSRICREEGLLHFDRSAVGALMEQASRWASHKGKLSLRFGAFTDLIRESSHWARSEGADRVSRRHVQKAVEEKIYRSNLLEEQIQELITEGTLMVDLSGAVVGQINGLSVYELGDFSFGRPSRITARVFLGQSGIVNIDREAKLSGRTHNKGVMILSGYLGGRYAREVPLSVSASLCFEQSYGEVEGDSASAAELIALLSGLSEIPILQGIAITGSVNQRGELQAIGGVNEKIEGFYAVCKARGLTNDQGVIIPGRNLKHLMLKDEVVEAVAAGRFHVYAAETVDEAMEILTGRSAGELQADGKYPAGTFNAAVMNRLADMNEKLLAMEADRPRSVQASASEAPDESLPAPSGP